MADEGDPQDDELKRLLKEREMARLAAQADDPITAAMKLLPADIAEDMAPVVRVGADYTPKQLSVAKDVMRRSPVKTQAYTNVGNSPDIYVNTFTPDYEKAQKGDLGALRALAGVLAHEQTHLKYGKDEVLPYDVQLRVLVASGASPEFVRSIEKAREYAILRQRQLLQTKPK